MWIKQKICCKSGSCIICCGYFRSITKDDEEIMELIEDKQTIVLLNKADLDQVVKVSDLKKKDLSRLCRFQPKSRLELKNCIS